MRSTLKVNLTVQERVLEVYRYVLGTNVPSTVQFPSVALVPQGT